jgi:hypothetical protein
MSEWWYCVVLSSSLSSPSFAVDSAPVGILLLLDKLGWDRWDPGIDLTYLIIFVNAFIGIWSMSVNTNMAQKFVMGFPHSYCRDNGQVTSTTCKENDCVIDCQYNCANVSQYDCSWHQINMYLFGHTIWQLTPWPLDNQKVPTCTSSARHVVSCLPHGHAVNTTCMSQTFWLDYVLIIKSKFTNLRNIMVNMQVIMSITAIQRLATVLCYLLHLYIITSVTAIQ